MPKLYPFQAAAVDRLRENIRRGVPNQILCAPTGAGKTVMAKHLLQEARRKGTRSIFVADRVSLIEQTSRMLDAAKIPHGVIQGDHWRTRPGELIQVASPQTLARREWPRGLGLVIVDEAHSLYRTTLRRIARRDVVTIGLTATPFTKGLGRYYDALVNATTTVELIRGGYLAPYRIFAPSEPDMDGARVSSGEWTDADREARSLPIVGDVVEQYLRHAAGRKFIAFGSTVAHCEEIQRQFLEAGVRTDVYSYRGTGEEKAEMVEVFRAPDSPLQGLISVSALAKGFDVPSVSCVIICRPLRSSFAEHVQMIGRGLRSDPDDKEKTCVILDHAGNTVRFGSQLEEFFNRGALELDDGKRKKKKPEDGTKEPTLRRCPSCAFVHKAKPHCPNCGHEYPAQVIEHEEGELHEVGAPVTGKALEERRRWFAELDGLRESRGYKPGWVGHQYKARFGSWPGPDVKGPAAPASQEVRDWVTSRMIAWAKANKKTRRVG